MLTPEDNALITEVGPCTPMGELMRQYWIPAALSSELAGADCPPVRVMLLCEKLIAFRDTNGKVGLVAEACPHRGASLFFGHNAECGLRCAYHGWKFDVTGACVDTPNELGSTAIKQKVRARAYPCVERGGVVWAYLGPRPVPPPLPDLGPNMQKHSHRSVQATLMECNWLQTLEGDLDIAHLGVLHRNYLEQGRRWTPPPADRPPSRIEWIDPSATTRHEVADMPAGCAFARCEEVEPARSDCWGIGQFLFPFYAMLPQSDLGSHWVVSRVPMDNHHTMTFGMSVGLPIRSDIMFGPEPARLPNTADWFGRHRLTRNTVNDFGIDRALQRDRESYGYGSGIVGQAVQDVAITCSMGTIVDRQHEHLGPSDVAVIRVRKRLLAAARALRDEGQIPPGVDAPAAYRVKQGSVVLPRGADWAASCIGA